MTDNINQTSQNLDGTKQQPTAASIVNLTDDDVVKVWDAVSAFIESYMKQSKGIVIAGFGTFSFIHKRIDVGNNKYLLIQRPVFVISEKFAQNHGLKFTRHPVNGSIPIHPLNYFHVQTQSTYKRDQIEQGVKHVLQVLNRSIAAQRNVEFTFSNIGKLHIRNGKVKMKFFKDFIRAVDENAGKHIIDNMCNRPNTCDSVMSNQEAARPGTSASVVLPRINSRAGASSMQAIQEENPVDGEDQDHPKQEPSQQEPSMSTTTGTLSSHVVKTTGIRASIENVIPIASLFSSADFIQPSRTVKKSPPPPPPPPLTPIKRSTSLQPVERDNEPTSNPSPSRSPMKSSNEARSSLGFTRTSARDRISSSLNVHPEHYQQILARSATSCSEHDLTQDLCRVCHDRAKRNIPVFLRDEKRVREEEEARLLDEYQHNLCLEDQKRREEAKKAAREEKQRIAAFNLGIAQAIRAKKLERPQTTDLPRSIIFQKRVKTPPDYLRKNDLSQYLETQIKLKQEEEKAEKADRQFIERLEQIQLAESLAKERDEYLKKKRHRQEELKNGLDNQIQNKPIGLPGIEVEIPYFGLSDSSTDKLKERRLHAIDIVRQQKDLIEQQQRQQLLQQISYQEHEAKVLQNVKEDLLLESNERQRREVAIRKDLETNWAQAVNEKHQRDEEEKTFLKAPQGALIHEQCDTYKRCVQCQRNLNNTGHNNFWKDTRYTHGTHVIV